jgi:hypothetical protein
MEKKMQKVKAVQDDSCHWYVIPIDAVRQFFQDENNEDIVDSGEFDSRWGKYRTGGDLNNTQLWAEI